MAEVANPLAGFEGEGGDRSAEQQLLPQRMQRPVGKRENENARCVYGSAPAWHSFVVDCSSKTDEAKAAEGKFPQFSPDGRWILCGNGPGTISIVDASSHIRVADARESVKQVLRSGPRDWCFCCFSPDSREVIILGDAYEDRHSTRLVAYDIATRQIRAHQDIWKKQGESSVINFASYFIQHQYALQPVPSWRKDGRNWVVLRAEHYEEATETINLATIICDVSTLQLCSFVDGWVPLAPLPDGESIAVAWAPTVKGNNGRGFRARNTQQRENQAFVIVVPLHLFDGAVELDPTRNVNSLPPVPVALDSFVRDAKVDSRGEFRKVIQSQLGLSDCMIDIVLRERNERAAPFQAMTEFMSVKSIESPAGKELLELWKIQLFEPGFGSVLCNHKLAFYSAPVGDKRIINDRSFDLFAMIAETKRDPLLKLEIRHWDGTLVSHMRSDGDIRYVDFSFDGRLLLVTTSSDLLIMDVQTGSIVKTVEDFSTLVRASFSPDSMTLVAGEGTDDFLHIFNYEVFGSHMHIVPGYYKPDWFERDRQLTAEQAAATATLGYKSAEQWHAYDADGAKAPGAHEGFEWWSLTAEEQRAAAAFGWTESSWNLDDRIIDDKDDPRHNWFEISPSLEYMACAYGPPVQQGLTRQHAWDNREVTLKVVRLSDGETVYTCECGPLRDFIIMFRWSPCSTFLAIATSWSDADWKQPQEWTAKHKDTKLYALNISVLHIQQGQMGRHTFRGGDSTAFGVQLTHLSAVNAGPIWQTHAAWQRIPFVFSPDSTKLAVALNLRLVERVTKQLQKDGTMPEMELTLLTFESISCKYLEKDSEIMFLSTTLDLDNIFHLEWAPASFFQDKSESPVIAACHGKWEGTGSVQAFGTYAGRQTGVDAGLASQRVMEASHKNPLVSLAFHPWRPYFVAGSMKAEIIIYNQDGSPHRVLDGTNSAQPPNGWWSQSLFFCTPTSGSDSGRELLFCNGSGRLYRDNVAADDPPMILVRDFGRLLEHPVKEDKLSLWSYWLDALMVDNRIYNSDTDPLLSPDRLVGPIEGFAGNIDAACPLLRFDGEKTYVVNIGCMTTGLDEDALLARDRSGRTLIHLLASRPQTSAWVPTVLRKIDNGDVAPLVPLCAGRGHLDDPHNIDDASALRTILDRNLGVSITKSFLCSVAENPSTGMTKTLGPEVPQLSAQFPSLAGYLLCGSEIAPNSLAFMPCTIPLGNVQSVVVDRRSLTDKAKTRNDRIFVAGSDDMNPPRLWERRLHSINSKRYADPGIQESRLVAERIDRDPALSEVSVLASVMCISSLCLPPSRDDIQQSAFHALTNAENLTAFESMALQVVVKHKWDSYARRKFSFNLLAYALYTLWATITVLTISFGRDATVTGILVCVLAALNAVYVIQEIRSILLEGSIARHFSSFWNILDASATGSVTFLCPVYFTGGSTRELSSVCIISLFIGLLAFLKANPSLGPLVQMIIEIIRDMRSFLVILSIVMLGFSATFMVLLPHPGHEAIDLELETSGGGDWGQILLEVFGICRDAFFAVFLATLGDTGGFEDKYNLKSGESLAKVYLVMFMVFVVIVLLNLLIAIMGDSYDKISENRIVQGTLTRANTICQIERFHMSKSELQDPLFFPRYLHVLQPVMVGEDEASEWAGRMKEMRLMMKANAQQTKAMIKELDEKVDKASVKLRRLETLETQIAQLQAAVK